MGFRGKQRANVAVEHEVRQHSSFDGLLGLLIRAWTRSRIRWHTSCCHTGWWAM
jgi:hypothetical protein